MAEEDSSQLKTVVIISLPPPDNPALGKTITAFGVSQASSQQPPQTHQQPNEDQEGPLPVELSPPQPIVRRRSSLKLLFPGNLRKVLGFLAISLFAVVLYSYFFPDTVQRLRRSDEGRESKLFFFFPLYSKNSAMWKGDLQLKLEGFMDINKDNLSVPIVDEIKQFKVNRLAASKLAANSSSAILPVRGNVYPDGLYYTIMLVGSPPRPYYLDIDTGSDLTWIQCDAPCTSCAKGANALYKPTKANIVPSEDSLCIELQKNQDAAYCENCQQCDYEIEYADRSSSMGVLVRDKLRLMIANGSLTQLKAVIGCAYDQQGMLLNTLAKTDGILGLSRSKTSLPSQLAGQGIVNNVVGHCLTTHVDSGAYMFIGDDVVPQRGMAWVTMLKQPSTDFYHTEIARMTYGGRPLVLGGQSSRVGGVVFDSGSSYTYFNKQAYEDLTALLKQLPGMELIEDESEQKLPICWQAGSQIRSLMDVKDLFKTIVLHFGSRWWIVSRKFSIPPEGYLVINDKGNVCLGILDGSNVHDGSTIIIGDISLRGQLVVYDNVKQRIGWTRSECGKPRAFQSFPLFEG